MMMGSPRAKYFGGKLPLHSDLRAREPISMNKLCLSNICGLNSNINSVHHSINQSTKPHILFLTETQISGKSSTYYVSFSGYKLLSSFRLWGGVCAYVRNNISCFNTPNLETGGKDNFMVNFHLEPLQNLSAVYTAHHPTKHTTRSWSFFSKKQITSSQNFQIQNSLVLAISTKIMAINTYS